MLLFLLVNINIVAFCEPRGVSEALIYCPVIDLLIVQGCHRSGKTLKVI